jgi:NAD(P)H-dependent FMN reductase
MNSRKEKRDQVEILAISGSIRSDSYNFALLRSFAKLSPENVNVTLLTSIEDIPLFHPEVDEETFPKSVNSLISKIRKSDGVIISSPEYAHGVPGGLKNLLDWLVATDALILKPVVVTTVSTSGLGGVRSYSALVQILSAMNSHVVIEGSFCVPYARIKFDATLNLRDEVTEKLVDVSFSALARTIEQRK